VSVIGTDESFLQAHGLSFDNIAWIISIDTEWYDVELQATQWDEQRMYKNAFWTDPEVLQQASPLYHISSQKDHPAMFIWLRSWARDVSSSENFIQALKDNSIDVTAIDGHQYSHTDINDAIWNPNDTIITPPLIKFLEDIFK